MELNPIIKQFQEKVSKEITLKEKGIHRYLVKTPFIFEDGDNLLIILKYNKDTKEWYLTDEGHTFLHLSYFMDDKDISKGTRKSIIENSKNMFNVTENKGEFLLAIEKDNYGDSLYNFVQCLLKVVDITFLERERVKSTFLEDFKMSINKIVKRKHLEVKFNTHLEQKDKNKKYPIDCVIETKKTPYFVFAINNDNKCREAMISILMFERWEVKFHAVGVFEDQTTVGRTVLAKFSDICEKQISDLDSIERFEKYIEVHNS
jgi:hypothetical protein